MSVRKDLTPNQGKRYELKQILFQASERFQAFLAGEIDAGTAPGLAVIFAARRARDEDRRERLPGSEGDKYFTTTYMVKDDGPVKRVQDLKGGTIGVVGIKTATDLWARAGLLNAGLVPDKDTKVVPMAFPAIGEAVRRQSHRRHLRRAFPQPRWRRAACLLFTATDAMGYDHELLDIFFGEKFLKAASRRGARLRRLRRRHQVVPRQHRAGQDRPAQGGLRAHRASSSRPPTGSATRTRVDVESLKKLSAFMRDKLQWLEKPVNVDSMVDLSYLPR